jgi:membrane-associated protease RseP (regulator of RpoE activity)
MFLLYSLIFIVVIHEAGHFIAAKLCKCGVEVFAVGFGKTLYEKRIGKTLYKLNLIPLGGYCKLKGELDFSKDPETFTNKRYSQKVFIALAGIIMNLITGIPAIYFGTHLGNNFLFAFGYYSIVIGLSNALPIPALDGSYPFWFLLEYSLGKEKTYKLMSKVFSISFIIILVLNIASIPLLIQLIQQGKLF